MDTGKITGRREFLKVSAAASLTLLMRGSGQAAEAKTAGPADPKLIEDLVAANRILVDKGVIDIRGHVSVRHNLDPTHYLLSRAIAPELVTAGDIMEFNVDSDPVDQKGREIYTERFIHGEIYRLRPDVASIIHAHTPSLIGYASSNVTLQSVYTSANFVGEGAPVFKHDDVGGGIHDIPVGHALAEALGKGGAVLMYGHGAVVVGPSIPGAVGRAVYLDVNAQIQSRILSMGGKPNYLHPPANAAQAPADFAREWEAWKKKVSR